MTFAAPLTVSLDSAGREADLSTRGKVNHPPVNAKNDYLIKTVVIDPGHGGHDPGCLGGNSQEKHLALGVSLKLADALRRKFPDLRVIMTRDADVFIPLHERAAIANRNQADLFISIHCNFMPKRSDVHGSETYVMGLHTAEHNLEVAKRENAAILLETDYEKNYDYDPNSPEGHIILSMFQNAFLEQSILFAEKVEARIHSDAQRHSRGVKQAGFVVLKETAMPSVLVETGFLSSRQEEAFLQTEEGQQLMAEALLNAFSDYRLLLEDGTSEPPVAVSTRPTAAAAPVKTVPAAGEKTTASPPVRKTPAPAELTGMVVKAPTAPPPSYRSEADEPVTPESGLVKVETERRIIPLRTREPERAVAAERPVPAMERTAKPRAGEIQFAVQLAASPGPIDTGHGRWQNLGYLVEVVQEDDLHKYQARDFSDLEQAAIARSELRDRGFPDAFIVAYKDGRRISLEKARREQGFH